MGIGKTKVSLNKADTELGSSKNQSTVSNKLKVNQPCPREIRGSLTLQKTKDGLRPTLRRYGQYKQSLNQQSSTGNYAQSSSRLGKGNTKASKLTHTLLSPISTHLNPTPGSSGQTTPVCRELEEITQGSWVLNTIQGYKISFSMDPYQRGIPESVVSKEEDVFISQEIQSLLEKGAITSAPYHPKNFFSTIFTVPKKGGERRPIINLKGLNRFIPHIHFKMEGIQSLRDIILPVDFMIELDLMDAYFSIPIHPSHWKYLNFRWKHKAFQFTCLASGLSSAPRIFTKVMKPVITYLRSLGIRMVVYLDDMLILAQTKEELLKWRSIVLDLLENLGVLINYDKLELEPTQSLMFLVFLINTVSMEIKLPKEKVIQAVQEAQKLLQAQQASARQLAHLIGVFSSTLPAILPPPLHYRGLQLLKHQALKKGGYDVILPLRKQKDDLLWWSQNLNLVNGQLLVRDQPSLQIETDASLMGWGAVCQEEQIGGPWMVQEKSLHINCLELLGATYAIQAFAKDKRDLVVHVLMDNSTAVAYINHMGGTKSLRLCSMTKNLWDWCLQRHLITVASHIPGKLNVGADLLSRSIVDRHDWMLDPTSNQFSLGPSAGGLVCIQDYKTAATFLQLET